MQGHTDKFELGTDVYRVDPKTGRASVAVDDFTRPNGLAFSPDEKLLYIVDSGATHGGPAHIRVFDVVANKLRKSRRLRRRLLARLHRRHARGCEGQCLVQHGLADPAEDGVRCYAPDGDMIGKVHLPETCANLCFGGKKRNRLFMCGSTSIYALYVDIQGAQLP